MIVSLLLSLDAQEHIISTMFPSEYGHYSLEFEFSREVVLGLKHSFLLAVGGISSYLSSPRI
jgi:hypothetical protein